MRLSPILRSAEGNRLLWWCPGCKDAHAIAYGPGSGPRWMWNGDVNLPVFNPSVLIEPVPPLRCHSFVGCNGAQPGEIVFLGDCTHELAGKVVPSPEWPAAA